MERKFRGRPLARHAFATIAASAPLALLALTNPAERTGKEVEQTVCFQCHESPKSPAPKVGDRNAWVPRLSNGIDALVLSAIRGHGGMPPRGGKAELTDNEIRNAILYMFNPQGSPEGTMPKVAYAAPPGQSVAAGGLRIYLGITSAEQMRQYRPGSPEATMHGGVPAGDGYEHVNITLIDSSTGAPVSGARVKLEVEQLGMDTHATALEPHPFGGAMSYGAYVRLLPKATYTFRVKVMLPGSGTPIDAAFPQAALSSYR